MESENYEVDDYQCSSQNIKPLVYSVLSLVGYLSIYVVFSDIFSKKIELLAVGKIVPVAKLQIYSVFGIIDIILTMIIFILTSRMLRISYKKYFAPFYFVIIYGVVSFMLTIINILVGYSLIK